MRTGSGSGFICQMNGKKYLITNEHVTRGGQPFSAILLDGRKLSFQSIEVADDRDLARLEITESTVKGLTVSAKTQNINDPVFVFGNSAGSGVATSLSGKILGIGPVEVETDAPFVAGNSGSPIVDQNGEVIAVATSATLHSDPSDWVKQGTRFTNVRRFGVKIDGAPWKLFNQQDYFIRTHALIDIKTFCVDLYNLRFTDSFIDTIAFRYNYNFVIEKKRYLYFPNFCKILSDAAVSFNKALDAEDEAISRIEIAARDPYAINAMPSRSTGIMLANQAKERHVAAYKKVYTDVYSLLSQNNWLTKSMKKDAEYWLEVVKIITEEKSKLRGSRGRPSR